GQGPLEVGRLGELEARVLDVERRVLAAHEATREELVPALGAVGLLVWLGDDGDLLAVAQVAEAGDATFALLLLGDVLHLAEDRGLQHGGAEPGALVGTRVGRPGGARRWCGARTL